MVEPTHAEGDDPVIVNSKRVRITTSGKMKNWISYSLALFEKPTEGESKTLIFHTLPAAVSLPRSVDAGKTPQKDCFQITPQAASSATGTISRLISVVEIIKREFFKHLEETRSTRMEGLHQYNEIGTLEDLGFVVTDGGRDGGSEEGGEADEQAKRAQSIIQALSGKNHPRQSQTPYMRVTLSLLELPELTERGATYQPPSVRRISKSAKIRAKKRAKNSNSNAATTGSAGISNAMEA